MNLSVVIPVKNRVAPLREAVLSAAAIPEVVDIVVVDDNSTPALEIGMLSLPVVDPAVRILKNGYPPGAQNARHTGFEAAREAAVLFLDSDDLLLKEGIKDLCEQAEMNP